MRLQNKPVYQSARTPSTAQALKRATARRIFKRADNQNRGCCARSVNSPARRSSLKSAMIETFRGSIITDLTPEEIAQLSCLAPQFSPEDIMLAAFPATSSKNKPACIRPVFEKRISVVVPILTSSPISSPAFKPVPGCPSAVDSSSAASDEDAPRICE